MRFILILLVFVSNAVMSQVSRSVSNPLKRPKLVVGLVVDQMRWDYLYRYYNRYAADGGFKRLINKGFSCENTFINYVPTYTACGHTTLYTGTVPAIHGITGNEWYDLKLGKEMYCAQDDSVTGTGTSGDAGKMSPRNMLTTTICDELRIATNFRGKVVGIAFKDRGGILPAGHSANAAYWYEAATGNFITSSYYMSNLPAWVTEFNARKIPDQYFKKGWNTLYPINTYVQSTADEQLYEGKPFGPDQKGFPYNLEKMIGSNYGALTSTPYGNTLTRELAMAAIDKEELGKDSITDFLAISFSSPDYIGHTFGPNSIEVEDNYLRLDKDLGLLFSYLDRKVGKDQYLVFISADHGVAHIAEFSRQNKLPGQSVPYNFLENKVDSVLKKLYGNYRFLLTSHNSQLFFNHRLMDSLKLEKKTLYTQVINFMSLEEGVSHVFQTQNIMVEPLPEKIRVQFANGYHPSRSGDIQYILKPGYVSGGLTGTTHGSWNPYDSHIPLVWYGWNIRPGKTNREVYMTDVAPTIAAMLRIQMPSGCVGNVIGEVVGDR